GLHALVDVGRDPFAVTKAKDGLAGCALFTWIGLQGRVVDRTEDDVLDVAGGDHPSALRIAARINRRPCRGERPSVRLAVLEATVQPVDHDLDSRRPLARVVREVECFGLDLAHCAAPPDANTGLPSFRLLKVGSRIS